MTAIRKAVTQSEAFQRWFGESKVVGEDGQPMVVFHGSSHPSWQYGRDRFNTRNGMGEGAYFTPDAHSAADYAAMDAEVGDGNPLLVPVYLSLQNPKIFRGGLDSQSISVEQKRELLALGHDGVFGYSDKGVLLVIVVFFPERIKSAIGNSGVFDLRSTSITDGESARAVAALRPSLDRWASAGAVMGETGAPRVFYHGTQTPDLLDCFVAGGGEQSVQSGDAYGVAVYLTSDPYEASHFAKGGGAVFPVYARGELLDVDAELTAPQAARVTRLANEIMLPSDKARFEIGRTRRRFGDVQHAREFFDAQRENWVAFGDGMDRARPEAIVEGDDFVVEFTDFDAPVAISSGKDAFTLFNAVGWSNLSAAGFDGVVMERGDGRKWVVMHRPDGNIKSSVGNSGAYDGLSASLTDQSPRYLVLRIDTMQTTAFEDLGGAAELARIARECISVRAPEPGGEVALRDANGNVVGALWCADTVDMRRDAAALIVIDARANVRDLLTQVAGHLEDGGATFGVLGPDGRVCGSVVCGTWPGYEKQAELASAFELGA